MENNHTDSLANLGAATEFQFRREIPVEHITNPSVQQPIRESLRIDTSLEWRDLIIAYLKNGTLPDDMVEARKLQHLATRYTLLGDILYKKSYSNLHSDPYLRCLSLEKSRKVMEEIHNGDYENHSRTLRNPQSHQPRILLAQNVRGH